VVEQYKRTHPDLIQVFVEDRIQSSYAARNKGISAANGQIIAMLDADCTPVPNWIEKGVEVLANDNVDLVGGNVEFRFSANPTAAEVYDSISNLQIKRNIEERGVAKTANLFVRRSVFEKIGGFHSDLKSGGDVTWTGKATSAGFKLVYSNEAKVYHPTRRLSALLQKQIRVGQGQSAIWKCERVSKIEILKRIFLGFLPSRFITIKKHLDKHPNSEISKPLLGVWIVAWLCNLATNSGRIKGLLHSTNSIDHV
ncbi:MAG: glycosyltransferase, partial [Chloroflexota bacterium]|nr:glycosyltransferase [Chloroflexota bacterium]